jgi:tetratricopeptide (TPR) repeat protein
MHKMKPAIRQMIPSAGCWILALLVCAYPETRPCAALLDSGEAEYKKFDNMRALEHFSLAFRTCPDNYEATMKMTRALIDAGTGINAKKSESFYTEGLRYADTLRKRYPDSGQSYFLTAIAAANLAQIKKAMKRIPFAMIIEPNIRKSIADDPRFAPGYVVLGGYCREVAIASPLVKMLVRVFYGWAPQGTLVESEQVLQNALKLDPGNNYAHLELARTYAAMGKKTEAIRILEQMQGLPIAWHGDKNLKEAGRQILRKIRK